MRYKIICEAQNSSNIYLTKSGIVKCVNSQILVVPADVQLADLNVSQVESLFGSALTLFALAFVLKQLRVFIFNRS